MDADPYASAQPSQRDRVELAHGRHLTYLLGGQRTTIQAGRLAIFWAAIPHQIVAFDGEAPYYVVTLPLSEFLRAGVELSIVHRVLHGELLIDAETDDTDEVKFRQWEREIRTDAMRHRPVLLEVQARLLRFAMSVSKRPTTKRISAEVSRADELACYIARNYHLPLTAQVIADANGVHPNYAMNLFRQTFCTTMTTFVTLHRISHAQRLLVTTEDTILSVALTSGFQSLSRFNEAFKAACGCSPRDYRKAHRSKTEANRRLGDRSGA